MEQKWWWGRGVRGVGVWGWGGGGRIIPDARPLRSRCCIGLHGGEHELYLGI